MFVRTDTQVLAEVNTHKWIEHQVLSFSPRTKRDQDFFFNVLLTVHHLMVLGK